jgi:hypothetical protein
MKKQNKETITLLYSLYIEQREKNSPRGEVEEFVCINTQPKDLRSKLTEPDVVLLDKPKEEIKLSTGIYKLKYDCPFICEYVVVPSLSDSEESNPKPVSDSEESESPSVYLLQTGFHYYIYEKTDNLKHNQIVKENKKEVEPKYKESKKAVEDEQEKDILNEIKLVYPISSSDSKSNKIKLGKWESIETDPENSKLTLADLIILNPSRNIGNYFWKEVRLSKGTFKFVDDIEEDDKRYAVYRKVDD